MCPVLCPQPPDYDAAYNAAKAAMSEAFFGPVKGGVYSPSVQYTLWEMGNLLLKRVPQVRDTAHNSCEHADHTVVMQEHALCCRHLCVPTLSGIAYHSACPG